MVAIGLIAALCVCFQGNVVFARIAGYVRMVPGLVRYIYFDGPTPPDFLFLPASKLRWYLWLTPFTILRESLVPLLVCVTPAALLFRLRRPRPAWGRILRQPGAIACLSVLAATLLVVDLTWLGVSIPTRFINMGGVVTASWFVLLVTRRWRSEPGWVDRLGRAVGVGWIVLAGIDLIPISF